MRDKICIVIGGNRGIGYEIAKELAARRARVLLVSRDAPRGRRAVAQMQAEIPEADIMPVTGDLSTIAGTRQLADSLLAQAPRIDVLVNNAGVWPTAMITNADGLEISFMVNFLAPFMLSHLLKERLIAGAPARIVHVNAGLYVRGKVDLARTPYGKDFGRIQTYCNSKLCGVLTLARETAMFESHGVTVSMVHPGVVNTDLGDMGGVLGWLMKQVKRRWMTPQQGAVAPVWLATAPELAETTGAFFNEKEVMPLDDVAKDEQLVRDLWRFAASAAGFESA